MEFSPDVVDGASVKVWRKHNFDRASLGVQTFDDAQLRSMARLHSGERARQAINHLADAGYEQINVDLIFGLPEQTSAAWSNDLAAVDASGATHCTFHPLSTRPKTAIERKAIPRRPHDNSLDARHAEAIAFFQAAGWSQTSAISFSRSPVGNPLEVAEADGQPTIGFGVGSRSYYSAVHTSTVPYSTNTPFGAVVKQYQQSVLDGQLPIANEVLLSATENARRSVILEMHHGRIRAGTLSMLDIADPTSKAHGTMREMVSAGWFVESDGAFNLTAAGSIRAADIGLAFASTSVRRSLSSLPLPD